MISKDKVREIVEEWLTDKEYFLVDVSVSADNCISVEIDHAEGVWIEDCVLLSKHVEANLSTVVVQGLSCSVTCGMFPDQGWLNLCLLHWQVDFSPLNHQGIPGILFKITT